MVLEDQLYRVEIEEDRTYTVDSADNRRYDVTRNPGRYLRRDNPKTLSISVRSDSGCLRIALVGPYTCDSECAVLDGTLLTVLQARTVTQLNITDGRIIRQAKLDTFGSNFALYQVETGYIIYGEVDITMLDFALNKKWSFSGKDIFVSISGKNAFELRDQSIHLWDFEDNEYEIDLNGRLIRENLTDTP